MTEEEKIQLVLERLKQADIEDVQSINPYYLTFSTNGEIARQLLVALKNNEDLRFTILTDLFAADFPEREKRFEIVYSLLSLKLNMRILVKGFMYELLKHGIQEYINVFRIGEFNNKSNSSLLKILL